MKPDNLPVHSITEKSKKDLVSKFNKISSANSNQDRIAFMNEFVNCYIEPHRGKFNSMQSFFEKMNENAEEIFKWNFLSYYNSEFPIGKASLSKDGNEIVFPNQIQPTILLKKIPKDKILSPEEIKCRFAVAQAELFKTEDEREDYRCENNVESWKHKVTNGKRHQAERF